MGMNDNIPIKLEYINKSIKIKMKTSINTPEKMIEKKLFLSKEVAAMLQCSERSSHNWIKEGKIKVHRIGRLIRFRMEDIEEFIKQCSGKQSE
jgi:excisionase family DNA binding protein